MSRFLTEWRPKSVRGNHRKRLPYSPKEILPNLGGHVGTKSVEELTAIMAARKSQKLGLTVEMTDTYISVSQGLTEPQIREIWDSL